MTDVVTSKQLITGFKRIPVDPDTKILECHIQYNNVKESGGVISIPFIHMLNSLPNSVLRLTYPEGEPKLPGYENASIQFGDAKVPGNWLYSSHDISEGESREIAEAFVEWLKRYQRIAGIVHRFDDASSTEVTETVWLDVKDISLLIVGNIQ